MPPQRRQRRGLLAAAGTGAAVVLLGAGFLAGVAVKGDDNTTLVTRAAQDAQRETGGEAGQFGGEGFSGQPGAGAPGGHGGRGLGNSDTFAAGEITALSGSTLTLKDQQGAAVTITVTSTTTVAGTTGGDLSALKVGQVAFVTGTQQADGSYVATAITTTPPFAHGDQDGDHPGVEQGEDHHDSSAEGQTSGT